MWNARIVVGLLLVFAAGCGSKKDAPPDAKTPPDDGKGTAAPPTTVSPKPAEVPPPPPPKPAEWEMDATKHAVPAAAATGKLGGVAIAPVAQFLGDTLSFRVLMKDMNTEREVKITFSPEQLKTIQGLKLTVQPEQPSGPAVPLVETTLPDPKNPKAAAFFAYPGGYALTLELGKKADGKLPGKVYLSLPGDEKSFLAGTFTAEWARLPTLPPEPDEAPFVHGSVGVANSPSSLVSVGYIGAGKSGALHIDMIGIDLSSKNVSARSDMSNPPRVSLIAAGDGGGKPGRYDHTHLEPGRYLIYARAGMTGPAVWQWVNVEPDTRAVVNLDLDGAKAGKVEVKLPADLKGKVAMVPPNDPAFKFPAELVGPMAFGLGLYADAADGKATFSHVSPGKYEVFAGPLNGTVTVEGGKTATVELMPPKK